MTKKSAEKGKKEKKFGKQCKAKQTTDWKNPDGARLKEPQKKKKQRAAQPTKPVQPVEPTASSKTVAEVVETRPEIKELEDYVADAEQELADAQLEEDTAPVETAVPIPFDPKAYVAKVIREYNGA